MLSEELENCRNKDAPLVAKVCFSTGARWGEAEGLRKSQLRNQAIHFTGTKSGKNRTVPVAESLYEELRAKALVSSDLLFQYCWGAFRKCGGALWFGSGRWPNDSCTQAYLRIAFYDKRRKTLLLQRVLGHQSLTMTMRYAHLALDHLIEARVINPLAKLN